MLACWHDALSLMPGLPISAIRGPQRVPLTLPDAIIIPRFKGPRLDTSLPVSLSSCTKYGRLQAPPRRPHQNGCMRLLAVYTNAPVTASDGVSIRGPSLMCLSTKPRISLFNYSNFSDRDWGEHMIVNRYSSSRVSRKISQPTHLPTSPYRYMMRHSNISGRCVI